MYASLVSIVVACAHSPSEPRQLSLRGLRRYVRQAPGARGIRSSPGCQRATSGSSAGSHARLAALAEPSRTVDAASASRSAYVACGRNLARKTPGQDRLRQAVQTARRREVGANRQRAAPPMKIEDQGRSAAGRCFEKRCWPRIQLRKGRAGIPAASRRVTSTRGLATDTPLSVAFPAE